MYSTPLESLATRSALLSPVKSRATDAVTTGAVSITQVRSAGVGSELPAASIARTAKTCEPTARSAYFFGDVHPSKAPPSKAHSKVPGSVAVKVNSAAVLLLVPDGPPVIEVLGGVASGPGSPPPPTAPI